MPLPKSLRGKIAEILNHLIQDGLITDFRTNIPGEQLPNEVVVTVTAPEADDLDGTWHRVKQALEHLPVDVMVRVDLP